MKSVGVLSKVVAVGPAFYKYKLLLNLVQDRLSFSKLLSETEDWLYEEGEDQPKQIYMDKLADLEVRDPFLQSCLPLKGWYQQQVHLLLGYRGGFCPNTVLNSLCMKDQDTHNTVKIGIWDTLLILVEP